MTVTEDLAVCIVNLKGRRHKDLIGTARALQRLRATPDYRSNVSLGRAVGVSGEIVREFLTLLNFPSDVQQRFIESKLGLEHGRRLWQLADRTRIPGDQIDWPFVRRVADEMESLTALDSRELVEHLLRNRGTDISVARQAVIASKPSVRPRYQVIAVLSEEDFQELVREAKGKSASIDGLVSQIVGEWLHTR